MDAYFYDGIRTPFGRRAGSLALVRPDDMLARCIDAVVERAPFPLDAYEEVVSGCSSQSGEDSRNVARHATLVSRLPVTTAASTVNRLCGSGLTAVLNAAQSAALGQGSLFIAGGVESMTRAPYVIGKSATPFGREPKIFEAIGARFVNPEIEKRHGTDSMPQTADNIARELHISREASDRFALRSQQSYARAAASGFYDDELLPIAVPGKKGAVTMVTRDEHPRAESSLDELARLKPLNPDGVVTAGNASGVNDGAAAMIIGSLEAGRQAGAKPRARLLAGAVSGIAPRIMGLGPVEASRRALARAGLALRDMDVIEINEAFAVQVLGCLQQMGLAFDDPRVNPNGGAIAIGHPLGASGARLALTAVRQLERIGGRYALVSMCIGMGQGIAVVFERVAD
jgi:acetyl-CoA C-acetyltransferase